MRLLFLCSGNTCRSPLAVAAWRALVPELALQWKTEAAVGALLALDRVQPESAGLCARNGSRAAPHALTIAREWGTSLDDHRARLLMPQIAREADLILTMTGDQAELVREHFEIAPRQVRVLGSYAPANGAVEEAARLDPLWGHRPGTPWAGDLIAQMGGRHDILDPFGGSHEAYQACGAQIRRCIAGLAHVLAGRN